jgi:hypothetical protein
MSMISTIGSFCPRIVLVFRPIENAPDVVRATPREPA